MSQILSFIEEEILDQYLAEDDNRPWIIGFSGGKDLKCFLFLIIFY
jgi:DNA sulfur modification protein DndC